MFNKLFSERKDLDGYRGKSDDFFDQVLNKKNKKTGIIIGLTDYESEDILEEKDPILLLKNGLEKNDLGLIALAKDRFIELYEDGQQDELPLLDKIIKCCELVKDKKNHEKYEALRNVLKLQSILISATDRFFQKRKKIFNSTEEKKLFLKEMIAIGQKEAVDIYKTQQYLAWNLSKADKDQETEEQCARLIELLPGDFTNYFMLANHYRGQGNYEAAEKILDEKILKVALAKGDIQTRVAALSEKYTLFRESKQYQKNMDLINKALAENDVYFLLDHFNCDIDVGLIKQESFAENIQGFYKEILEQGYINKDGFFQEKFIHLTHHSQLNLKYPYCNYAEKLFSWLQEKLYFQQNINKYVNVADQIKKRTKEILKIFMENGINGNNIIPASVLHNIRMIYFQAQDNPENSRKLANISVDFDNLDASREVNVFLSGLTEEEVVHVLLHEIGHNLGFLLIEKDRKATIVFPDLWERFQRLNKEYNLDTAYQGQAYPEHEAFANNWMKKIFLPELVSSFRSESNKNREVDNYFNFVHFLIAEDEVDISVIKEKVDQALVKGIMSYKLEMSTCQNYLSLAENLTSETISFIENFSFYPN